MGTHFTDGHLPSAIGHLKVIIARKTIEGIVHETYIDEKQLIVEKSNEILAGLIAGDLGPVDRVAVGLDSTAEALTDTTISAVDSTTLVVGMNAHPVTTENIAFVTLMDQVTHPTVKSTMYNWEVSYHEANGLFIKEYGLCNTEGYLYSRKVRGGIEKTEDIALIGTWTITYLPIDDGGVVPL